MEKKRILAIDPGSRKLGYAIVDFAGKNLTYIQSGVLDHAKIPNYFDRLPIIWHEITEIIAHFTPQEIALEALIYVKGTTSLIKLAHARGAALAALPSRYRDQVFEYAPNLIKATVTGHGHATKATMQRSVTAVFGVNDYASDDESDALGIAICHAFHRQRHRSFGDKPTRGQTSLQQLAKCAQQKSALSTRQKAR